MKPLTRPADWQPRLQNFVTRTKLGDEIRKIFAEPNPFTEVDFAKLEQSIVEKHRP